MVVTYLSIHPALNLLFSGQMTHHLTPKYHTAPDYPFERSPEIDGRLAINSALLRDRNQYLTKHLSSV